MNPLPMHAHYGTIQQQTQGQEYNFFLFCCSYTSLCTSSPHPSKFSPGMTSILCYCVFVLMFPCVLSSRQLQDIQKREGGGGVGEDRAV